MSGLYAPEQVSAADRDFTTELMSAIGKVCWVDNEDGINSIIAAAGVHLPISSYLWKRCSKRLNA